MSNETIISLSQREFSTRSVTLDYTQNQPLEYGNDSIDEISSSWNAAGDLVITVNNGASWDPTIESGPSSGLTVSTSQTTLTIRATFPSSAGEYTEWVLSNGDAPVVKLRVVVKRMFTTP